MSNAFHDMERLNIVFDIWIDAEEYDSLPDYIKLEEKLEDCIGKLVDDNSKHKKETFSLLLKLANTNPGCDILNLKSYPDRTLLASDSDWNPLFLAKYLRAKILEKGTDDYTKYLEDLVTYLQRKLPYLSPGTTEESILQSLYFQELSACGKPGRESLGFAIQANELLTKEKKEKEKEKEECASPKDDSHYSLELYILWAKYNQGIGYSHSGQKDEASEAFDKIIHNFAKNVSPNDKDLWEKLLFIPAILSKAELLETLQFSYHTIKTLEKLDDTKNKSRLIKEALAYRDMGRLNDAKDKIKELLLGNDYNDVDLNKIKIEIFFEAVEEEIKKNIKSKTLGLLFDYFLLELEQSYLELEQNYVKESDSDKKERDDKLKNDSIVLSNQFKKQLPTAQTSSEQTSSDSNDCELIQNKQDRASFYQQATRFLKILSDRLEKGKDQPTHDHYSGEIKELYGKLKDYLLPDSKDPSKKEYRLKLEDLEKYDYNRYTESMEKFYRNLTSCNIFEYQNDEIDLLKKLNKFEEEKSFLFKFKELERIQRINQLVKSKFNWLRPVPCRRCFRNSREKAFNGVLSCCSIPMSLGRQDEPDTRLIAEDYENIMERENNRFLDYLAHKSRHPVYQIPKDKDNRRRSLHFMGLQRWNSQTPTLTMSQGGGYFLYEQDKDGNVVLGIAIDPGFDFVDNLFHMGFTMHDIDFILLSHAHSDHIRDFEPIISSLLDLRKRKRGAMKKIHAVMTWGVYDRLKHVITNPTLREFLADTYIVDINKDLKPGNRPNDISFRFKKDKDKKGFTSIIDDNDKSQNIEIKTRYAYHNDFSEISDSYGYIIDFYDGPKNLVYSFGYTGDTKWHSSENIQDKMPEIHTQYKECDAVCIHLGALIESENGKRNKFKHYKGPECDALIEEKQHLYLFGLLRYLQNIQENSCKNRLLLISEFGEELKGGIRIDFIRRLNELLKPRSESPVCLPVDIGLNVVLASQIESKEWEKGHKVWCYGCEKFVDYSNIGYRHFSHGNSDEALFYFCNTCLKSKPENFFQSKMRLICENGLPLEKAFENK